MKLGVILIVANGDAYIRQWLDHYYKLVGDNIGIAHGFTKEFAACGFEHDKTLNILNDSWLDCHISTTYIDKTDQQNTALKLLDQDTDYVLIADIDEFYHEQHINNLKVWLSQNQPDVGRVTMHHFFRDRNHVCYGGDGWGYDTPVHRVFKYKKGMQFHSHRPIGIIGHDRELIIPAAVCKCFHYSYIDERMVREKIAYYSKVWPKNAERYNDWFVNFWSKWTPDTREELEQIYSAHLTDRGAKTKRVALIHPI